MDEIAARVRKQEEAGDVTREAAVAAWWAPRLGAREPVGLEKLLKQPVRTEEDRMRWRVALEEITAEHLRDCANCDNFTPGWHQIGVDYDPDALLEAAAARAGITLGRYELAGKTTMILDDEGIRVSDGYGAAWEFIWRHRAEDDETAAWLREQAESDLAAEHGPDESARAESVLAVLREYVTLWGNANRYAEFGSSDRSLENQAKAFKRVVRMLAYGYRHREGWNEAWKP
jgi:hypothetical protein